MKLLICLWCGLGAGGVAYAVFKRLRCLPSDMATRGIKRIVETVRRRNPRIIDRYSAFLSPIMSELSLPFGMDLDGFLALQSVSGCVMGIFVICALPSLGFWMMPLSLVGGMMLPYVWLKSQQAALHTALLKSLPDCLERIALVMDIGLDLSTGLRLYADKAAPGPLRSVIQDLYKDMRMGRSRAEAFSALSQRTRFVPLQDLCRTVIQSMSLGTPLAPILREQAAALRLKRMQRAEEKAAQAPVKILFPLFVFIFPCIFIVLLGPVVMLFMGGGF